jgi:ABC-type nitrate/sulfonate/bicarbonate transport system substrate-binding protein
MLQQFFHQVARAARPGRIAIGLGLVLTTATAACAPSAPPAPTQVPAKAAQPAPAAPAAPAKPAAKAEAPAAKADAPAAKTEAAAKPKTEAAKPAPLPPMRVIAGSQTTWTTHLSVLVAMAEGYFQEVGLTAVDWKKAGNDSLALAALISNNGDIGVSLAADGVAKLVEKGETLYIVGATSNKLPHILFAQKDISQIEGLKGKKIGTDLQGVPVDGYIEKGLATKQLKLSDVSLVRVGNSAERFKALDNQVVDAALIGPSEQPRARAGAYPQLMNLGDLFDEYLQRTYVVSGKYFDENPAAVDAFMLAMVRAHVFLHKPENMDRLWSIVEAQKYDIEPTYFKTSVEAQVALLPQNAMPGAKGLQIVLDEIKADTPSVTPEKLLRFDAVRKANEKLGMKVS